MMQSEINYLWAVAILFLCLYVAKHGMGVKLSEVTVYSPIIAGIGIWLGMISVLSL